MTQELLQEKVNKFIKEMDEAGVEVAVSAYNPESKLLGEAQTSLKNSHYLLQSLSNNVRIISNNNAVVVITIPPRRELVPNAPQNNEF